MTDKAISPLRRRLIEDMTIRRLGPGTQHQYIRHVKSFADFVGRSPDKATPEDVRRYQLRLASMGTTVPTLNAGASALRFFFRVTLKRPLAAIATDRQRPRKHVERAQIVLASADRRPAQQVARSIGVSRPRVWRWQQRFAESGIDGLLRDKTRKPGKAASAAATAAR